MFELERDKFYFLCAEVPSAGSFGSHDAGDTSPSLEFLIPACRRLQRGMVEVDTAPWVHLVALLVILGLAGMELSFSVAARAPHCSSLCPHSADTTEQLFELHQKLGDAFN